MGAGRVVRNLVVTVMVLAACGGGGGEEATTDTVALEETQPIVDIDPCDLIDSSVAQELSGVEVKDAQSSTEDDGTTSCDFEFADEADAEQAGSALAASLSIGPGDEADVPGGALARSLSIGEASAVEEDEDEATVRVVYVVQEIVVRVEVVPGSGELTPEIVDAVIEFTETTEAPVTEAVTGEPFEADDATTTSEPGETTTTTFVDEDVPEGPRLEVDGGVETLTVERAGGLANVVFEAEAGDIVFVDIPAATRAPADSLDCLQISIIDPQDANVGAACAREDGSAFIDRTALRLPGTYQIVFDPGGPLTGTVDVVVTSVTDEEGTIDVDGATETLTVVDKGGAATVEFDARAGGAIFVTIPAATRVPADSLDCLQVSIINPDGANVGAVCAREDGSAFIDRTELTVSGTHLILFEPGVRTTGSVQVQISAAD